MVGGVSCGGGGRDGGGGGGGGYGGDGRRGRGGKGQCGLRGVDLHPFLAWRPSSCQQGVPALHRLARVGCNAPLLGLPPQLVASHRPHALVLFHEFQDGLVLLRPE